MSVPSVITTLFHIVVTVLVRTSIAAEPLTATAELKPLIRTVARESQQLTEGYPDGELTGAKPAQDAKKPSPVRRIAHDGDEQETWTLISDSFCVEIGIACIGFSITALMQRFVGAKSRTLRKKINQPTSESPRSQSKSGQGFPRRHSDNALASRAPSKQQPMPATASSRNASAAAARDSKNDSDQPFMTECDGHDAANDQSDKLERPDMRKLLALVTAKPPLKDIPVLVLRCIAGIEARTGKTLTSKQTLDALIQLLRACASGKCFKEGLVAFDALESRLGSGSHSLWSLLLYIATEAGAYERCEDFYLRLQDAPGPAGRASSFIRHELA